MNLELFILGGYGQFVWPAFIFSFVSCAVLFVKVRKELTKQEKAYLKEYGEPKIAKIITPERKKITAKIYSENSI